MRPVLLFCFLSLVWGSATNAQTTSIASGNWNDVTVWSSGVPGPTTNASVSHPLLINQNISISTGYYTFAANATDNTNFSLTVGNGGVIDVTAGTTTFGGNGNINNFSTLIVRSGATLILGATSIGNNVTLLIESGGTLIINGNLTNGNNSGTFTIGGLVYVNGNFNNGGNADLIGTGDIITTGSLNNGGSSTTFGSGQSCNTGPCSGRNLCGFTNSITANQARCSGLAAAALTGTTNAGSPFTYLWEYSTTSSTTGFASAPGTNSNSSYSPGTLSQTTWFRRKVTSGGCTGTSPAVQVTIMPANSGWIGGFSTNWNTGDNWCNRQPPNSSGDAVIPSVANNMPIINNNVAVCRDLIIHPGATLTFSGSSATLTIYGDVTNNGTFNPSSGTVNLNGTSPQTFTSSVLTFRTLTFNNSTGITFNTLATVTDRINMTAGAINLMGNNLLLTDDGSTNDLTYTSGWFYNGAFSRAIPASTFNTDRILFPMGTISNYRPFKVGRTVSGNSGVLRVSHTGAPTTSDVSFADPSTSTTVVKRQDSYWTVSNTGITSGTWTIETGGTGFGTVGELADLRVIRSASVVGSHGSVSGNISPNENFLVSRTDLTTTDLTNTFYIGSVDAIQTPLPIRLLSFSGYFSGNGTTIDWSTASEDNFDHFLLERSVNGIDFKSIARISGKGGHNIISKYSHLDETAHSGRYYYRLKIINVDESFEYSKTIAIIASGEKNGISVYPNPASNQSFHVKLNEDVSSARLVLLDELGKIHLDANLSEGDNEIPLRLDMPNGIYVVRVLTGSGIQTMKLVVAR